MLVVHHWLRTEATPQFDHPAIPARSPGPLEQLADQILSNLAVRSGYTQAMALDTVVFAIRKQVVDFAAILR